METPNLIALATAIFGAIATVIAAVIGPVIVERLKEKKLLRERQLAPPAESLVTEHSVEIVANPAPIPKSTRPALPAPPSPTVRGSRVDTITLALKWDTARARCKVVGGKYVVQKGSTARAVAGPSLQDAARRMRSELLKSGVLAKSRDEQLYTFAKDYSFETVSAAASVIAGVPANGRRSWVLEGTETTFGDWQDAHPPDDDEDLGHEVDDAPRESPLDSTEARHAGSDRPDSAAGILAEAAERAVREGRLLAADVIDSGRTRYLVNPKPVHKSGGPFFKARRLSNGLYL